MLSERKTSVSMYSVGNLPVRVSITKYNTGKSRVLYLYFVPGLNSRGSPFAAANNSRKLRGAADILRAVESSLGDGNPEVCVRRWTT